MFVAQPSPGLRPPLPSDGRGRVFGGSPNTTGESPVLAIRVNFAALLNKLFALFFHLRSGKPRRNGNSPCPRAIPSPN